MRTDDLIAALAADGGRTATPIARTLALLALAAALVAALVFALTIGPRPDIADAATTLRFLFKFVVTLTLAGSAYWVLLRASQPGRMRVRDYFVLAAAPALLCAGVLAEFIALPPAAWAAAQAGTNSLVCLTYIPLIGLGPLALFLAGLRQGAPTHPGLAGVVAGVLAGALAATLYAAHCTDDSPLFVITWYSIAIAGLAVAGGLLGRLVARW
jgi:hypothetical protein